MDIQIRYQNYRLNSLRQGIEPMAFEEWQSEIQGAVEAVKTALK